MVKRKRTVNRSLFLFIIAVVQNRTVGADTIRPPSFILFSHPTQSVKPYKK